MIKKGDLVMVVRPTICCGLLGAEGRVYEAAHSWVGYFMCHHCRWESDNLQVVSTSDFRDFPAARLLKIDPPSTGELSGVPLKIKEPV